MKKYFGFNPKRQALNTPVFSALDLLDNSSYFIGTWFQWNLIHNIGNNNFTTINLIVKYIHTYIPL